MSSDSTYIKAMKIHQNAVVVEGHSDILVDVVVRQRRGEKNVIREVFLPRMKKGGVRFSVLAVGGDHSSFVSGTEYPSHAFAAIQNIDRVIMEAEDSGGEFFIVREKADLDRRNGIGMILFIEGALPLSGSLHILRTFYRLGLRVLGFAWSWRNEIADGTAEERSSGLSRFGIEVVKEMNRLGMLIDVSHLSDACFYHVLEITKAPVIASHSNARTLCNHPRNLTDDMIKKIAHNGGVVGICFFPHFVTSRPDVSVDDLIDHLDYIKTLVGMDHISLGPDFLDYRIQYFTGMTGSFASVQEGSTEGPKDPASYFRYPKGVEDVTQLPNFTHAMVRRGYSEDEIRKVLGGNLFRVFKEVWK